jgi:hypothetical protein
LKMHRCNGTKTVPAIPILSPIPFFISNYLYTVSKACLTWISPLNLLLDYRSKKLDSVLLYDGFARF